jgi:hypothetical protein
MSPKAKRVLIYTISLLVGPMPMMPFVRGTPEYALGMTAYGAILTLSSYYVARGELGGWKRFRFSRLVGNRLLIASLITLPCGALLFLGSIFFYLGWLKFGG